MKTKHIFVPMLDVGEKLPFAIKKHKDLKQNLQEQEKAKKALVKFIDLLETKFKEPIYYMGIDVIGEKSYERFIFDKGGFFEVMVEEPLAMNAHFVHKSRAKRFEKALKATLKEVLPKEPTTKMLLDSIEIQDEKDQSLTVNTWHKLKEM